MNRAKLKLKTVLAVIMAMMMMVLPVCAKDVATQPVAPCFGVIDSAALSIGFDKSNVVYCDLTVLSLSHTSGVSGVMKLLNSRGGILATWAVSDYDDPIDCEFTYQGQYGKTYTVTFEGYAYSNNGTLPDRLELSVTDKCVD